jgi:hypothetical protein
MKRVFSLVRNGINFIFVVSWIMLPTSPMSTGNLGLLAAGAKGPPESM